MSPCAPSPSGVWQAVDAAGQPFDFWRRCVSIFQEPSRSKPRWRCVMMLMFLQFSVCFWSRLGFCACVVSRHPLQSGLFCQPALQSGLFCQPALQSGSLCLYQFWRDPSESSKLVCSLYARLFLWDCGSDCKYRCMIDVEVLRAERGLEPVGSSCVAGRP